MSDQQSGTHHPMIGWSTPWPFGQRLPDDGWAITTYPARERGRRYKRGSVLVTGIDSFREAIDLASAAVEALGITLYVVDPTRPSPSYGYQHSVFPAVHLLGKHRGESYVEWMGVSWR